MLRILAGEKKGQRLRTPRTKSVRPTTAGVRRVLFDIVGAQVVGCRWLDLFAGSGAVGLEALSRGAAECVLVESSRACVAAALHNIDRLAYADRCELVGVRTEKALKQLAAMGRCFDIVFLDPPYRSDDTARSLLALGGPKASSLLASPGGLVIAQVSSRLGMNARYGSLFLDRERVVGDTRLCFFRAGRAEIAQPADGGPDIANGAPG